MAMADEEGALVLCLNVLRWSGLSFTRVGRSPGGDLVARDSAPHLLVNVAVAGVFLVSFFLLDPNAYESAAEVYKSSTIVYPLYTKLLILVIVALSLCGNFYNRRFVVLINFVRRVRGGLGPEAGGPWRGRKGGGRKVLFGLLAYLGALTGLSLWTDTRLTVRYDRTFRIVHYLCFYCLTLFTAHFVLTMNYARENFRRLNAAFGSIAHPKAHLSTVAAAVSGAPPHVGRKIRACMEAFVDLREMEEMTNEVFGKQIFLVLVLAFSSACVNAYYFITLNLYGTSSGWLNLAMWIGFLESAMVAFMNTRAAELAVNEANRVTEVVLGSFLHFHDWQMHNRIKYFVLLTRYNPVKVKAWVFYAISYESLLKVMLTSSAITALILQCDFLRGHFGVRPNGTRAAPLGAWD